MLSATSNDPQSILSEVSKLRQMYDECKASQSTVQGLEPKVVAESNSKSKLLNQEIVQKNGVIKSLEQTLLTRDRAYREATTQNKNLISQLHTQKVSTQERETLKRAVETAKAELFVAQKALKQAGGVKIVYKDRPIEHEKIVEKIVYRDRPIAKEKVVEKVVEKTVYKELKVPKSVPRKVLKAEAIRQEPLKKQVVGIKVTDEQKRRQADKLALELERKKSTKSVSETSIKKSAPSAYRMATIASIYNAPNGTKVDMWEAGRSFTSGTSNGGWVKITGYFVDRVWHRADEGYWVKESDVIRR